MPRISTVTTLLLMFSSSVYGCFNDEGRGTMGEDEATSTEESSSTSETTGPGDSDDTDTDTESTETGDPAEGSGDGDGDPGDGDGDPGDGDGDPGDGDGDPGDGDGDEPCVDECNPNAQPGCADEQTALVCVIAESGCYEYTESQCQGEDLCEPLIGCVAPLPSSCAEQLADDPQSPDGVYMIDLDGPGGLEPFEVMCDMSTNGGGWTLIAYNDETTTFVEFDRSWQDYREGFGDLVGGALGWLGNDRIHLLTEGGAELEVRHNHPWTNVYADFSVGDEASLYELSVSTTPDSLDGGWFANFHGGLPFSTFDNDQDTYEDNCAEALAAGWWYGACAAMSIASKSDPNNPNAGVYWRPPPPNDAAPLWLEWVAMWVR